MSTSNTPSKDPTLRTAGPVAEVDGVVNPPTGVATEVPVGAVAPTEQTTDPNTSVDKPRSFYRWLGHVAGLAVDAAGAVNDTLNQPEVQKGLTAAARTAGRVAEVGARVVKISRGTSPGPKRLRRAASAAAHDRGLAQLAANAVAAGMNDGPAVTTGFRAARDGLRDSFAKRRQAREERNRLRRPS